ncbi:MAG TPA: HD domain-containing protein, partial [Thermoanaerobaculia bacterium]|nr:HD domain-containing protein [Thermoanaerobaculia bacterium]
MTEMPTGIDRATAWGLVTEHVQTQGLRRHMLAVEAAMRWYAAKLDADPEEWGIAGLLHDFDWEIHPTLEAHPAEGAPMLRAAGVDESIVQAILSHNTEGTGVERSRPLDFGLLACDEITGLIIAAALVRPSKDVREVEVKSLKKRWKEK